MRVATGHRVQARRRRSGRSGNASLARALLGNRQCCEDAADAQASARWRLAVEHEIPAIEARRMIDLLFVTTAAGFFALAIGYVRFCEKLRGGGDD